MRCDGARVGRRTLLRGAAGLAGVCLATAGCARSTPDPRLTIAGGVRSGVYYTLSEALAGIWTERLELSERPDVLLTAGSVENMQLLSQGRAQLAISQVDIAADTFTTRGAADPTSPRALARIYDDVTHVVVRAEAPYRRLADLRGARVSVGPPGSGYYPIAQKLLEVAGVGLDGLGARLELGLEDARAALQAGQADAFFWSGGVPTGGIADLSRSLPIRLVDLSDVLSAVRERFPVYSVSTIPAATYRLPAPVSTLSVRNVLLATAAMPDTEARMLVKAVFDDQPRVAAASPAAVTVDSRSAIGTQPVPLHPGAAAFYRTTKGY